MSECELAFKAALELVSEKCKGDAGQCDLSLQVANELIHEKCGIIEGVSVYVEEMKASVKIPSEVLEVMRHNSTREEKVEAVAESSWPQGWSKGMCRFVTGSENSDCVKKLSRQLAEKVVG